MGIFSKKTQSYVRYFHSSICGSTLHTLNLCSSKYNHLTSAFPGEMRRKIAVVQSGFAKIWISAHIENAQRLGKIIERKLATELIILDAKLFNLDGQLLEINASIRALSIERNERCLP